MVALSPLKFDVYEDMVERLGLAPEAHAEAIALLQAIEPEGYIGGMTPKIWSGYVWRVLGAEAGRAFDTFAEGLGAFRLGRPMHLRDIVVCCMWVWRAALPDLPLEAGCAEVIRLCGNEVIHSPGVGILLSVLDQGFLEIAHMTETMAAALTSFRARVRALSRGHVEVTFSGVSAAYIRTGLLGSFRGLLDMSKAKGEVTFREVSPREGVLTILYDAPAGRDAA